MNEETFREIAAVVALAVEIGAVVLVALGALEGFLHALPRFLPGRRAMGGRKEIWVQFAVWLLLGLEFELAADVIRSAISPSWTAIGQLGAIAAIRTILNYFLEQDIAGYREGTQASG